MKTEPYYSVSFEDNPVYHDNDACPYGKQIKPENRKPGTDGRKRCSRCKKMAGKA
jgi:hypothetical protein